MISNILETWTEENLEVLVEQHQNSSAKELKSVFTALHTIGTSASEAHDFQTVFKATACVHVFFSVLWELGEYRDDTRDLLEEIKRGLEESTGLNREKAMKEASAWEEFIDGNPERLANKYKDAPVAQFGFLYQIIDRVGNGNSEEYGMMGFIFAGKAFSTFMDTIKVLITKHKRFDILPVVDAISEQVAREEAELGSQLSADERQVAMGLVNMLESINFSGDETDVTKDIATKIIYDRLLENQEQYRMPYQNLPQEVMECFDWIEQVFKSSIDWDVTTHAFRVQKSVMFPESSDDEEFQDEVIIFLTIQHDEEVFFATASAEHCFMDGEHWKDNHQGDIAEELLKFIANVKMES